MNCNSCPQKFACSATRIRHCNGGRYSNNSKFKIGDNVIFIYGSRKIQGRIIDIKHTNNGYEYNILDNHNSNIEYRIFEQYVKSKIS